MKPYFNEAFNYVNSFYPMSKEQYERFYNSAKHKQIKKGDILLDAGTIPTSIYFIAKGIIRSYVILDDGKEVTKALYYPYLFFTLFESLLTKKPTNGIYEALVDCDVFEIDFQLYMENSKNDNELQILYSKFLEYFVIEQEKRFMEMSTLNASQRYILLRERIPNLDNLIPQYHIASWLGITAVQLSRIRAKLSTLTY